MKYPEPPSLSMKVVLIMGAMLVLLIFLLLNSCSTFKAVSESPLEPVVENKINEIENSPTMTASEKQSTVALIKSLKDENGSLRGLLKERDSMISNQAKKIQECQTALAETSRDAGKSDGLSGLGWWIIAILGFGVFFTLAYLWAKSKVPSVGTISDIIT